MERDAAVEKVRILEDELTAMRSQGTESGMPSSSCIVTLIS